MNRSPRLPGLAVAVATLFPLAVGATPQVEEAIMGPAAAEGVYVVSPSGGRIAHVGAKGTRLVVTIDGVAGPEFDELYSPTGQSFFNPPQVSVQPAVSSGQAPGAMAPVLFIADGAHYAYAGRQGNECVVIHDGKEVARLPRERLSLNYGALALSPRGRFVTFMEIENTGARARWRMNVGGKPGPWSSNNHGMSPVFSADDRRYAYNAASESDTSKTILVVDGAIASYAGLHPVFTPDSNSLLSISPATTAAPKPAVLLDGKPVITGLSVDKLVVAPSGGRWGAIVRTRMEGFTQVPAFFLEGKEVPGTEGAKNAWFSADGKHYAVVCENSAARSMFMVIDGKKQPEYPSVSADEKNFWWTPDGTKFIYSIAAGGRPFLVVNGEEIPITMLIGYDKITMPRSGDRYGYGTRDGSNRLHSLVVDGANVLPEGLRPYDNTLAFSADGGRYGFFAGPAMRNEMTTVVLDGVVQDGVTPAYFHNWVGNALYAPALVFSGDGKHVAHLGTTAGERNPGILVDGKLVQRGPGAVWYPTFTPDGRHLFWLAEELVAGPPPQRFTTVYVDGLPAVRANGQFFRSVPGSFTVDGAGVATFFAADGETVKRYRITPSADTSVATLLERGDALAAAAAAAKEAEAKAAEEVAAAARQAEADAAALRAQQLADQQARAEAANQARLDAIEARKKARLLQLENAKRKRQGLPPLTELPE